MERQLASCAVLLCLVIGCSDKSESESESRAPVAGGQVAERRTALRPHSGGGEGERPAGPGSGRSRVRNRYAEEHWQGSEEENQWTADFAAAATPAEKIAVVERKQVSGPESLAPLIRLSLREPDEQVRTEAVRMLGSFVEVPEEVVDLVLGATHDPSSEVRTLAMEAAVDLHPETRLEIYGQTIMASYPEVRRMTVTELGRMRSKPAFEVLMTGLQYPDPVFRDEVNIELNLLVNRRFESYEQADLWWDGNVQRFSDNMLEIRGSE